jgi:hypothetical protein
MQKINTPTGIGFGCVTLILSLSLSQLARAADDPCEAISAAQDARRKAVEADYQKRIDALSQALNAKIKQKSEKLKDDQKAAEDLGTLAGAYIGSAASPAGTALGAAIGNALGKGYVVEREDREQEVIIDLPEIDPKGNRTVTDLPQIEMHRETRSLDLPEVRMVRREVGRKPVKFYPKVEYDPIYADFPETVMVRKEISADVPTIVVKRVEIFTPSVSMKRQTMKLKMPSITVRSTTEAADKIIQATVEIQGPLTQMAAEMQTAINAEITKGLKEVYNCKFEQAEAQLKAKTKQLENLPVNAEKAAERNALIAEIESLKGQILLYKQFAGVA